MNKIRDINQYIDTVKKHSNFFQNYYFHSLIDLNLIKLDLILKHGILSKNLIEQKIKICLYTHAGNNFNSKNGYNYISLTHYTNNCQFNPIFESFPLHTLTSTSLLVNKNIDTTDQGERQTFFDDEIFCPNIIPKTKLEGIILPEHLSNLQINEVNCLPNDLSCYKRSYINNWINCMEVYFKQKISEKYIENLKISLEQLWNILEEYEKPENWIESALKQQRNQYGEDLQDILGNILQILWEQKLKISNPTYIDVLTQINEDDIPIYEIKQKCLKKIN